ncbi:hypothetical protein COU56_04630 [Candidatus Pacearchaeota archaeon CG10_big_fil_rev_8_21_14_0_10_31_9]|nr:MAG: hypothetical protein AUJ62_02845 [Candidatus Pacearchaeota archaeon CG1_02_32_21]PIN91756.1 MAG: hypothetical protein COU56_04630 [Candidatus Pacearchaeota archaeon CG10_big_fil_rev_8_21_14_0_10_31_9]PIZ83776.1 MAG: hypothetical protein COX97_00530 [Candidatus Pacearchaeota archaeon CG_4_10_14_0_2_um_filter_05_32_18]
MISERTTYRVNNEAESIELARHERLRSGDIIINNGRAELVIGLNEKGFEVIEQERSNMIGRSLMRLRGDGIFLGRYIPGFEISHQHRESDGFDKYKILLEEAGLWRQETSEVAV